MTSIESLFALFPGVPMRGFSTEALFLFNCPPVEEIETLLYELNLSVEQFHTSPKLSVEP